jgi:hypothetical protein
MSSPYPGSVTILLALLFKNSWNIPSGKKRTFCKNQIANKWMDVGRAVLAIVLHRLFFRSFSIIIEIFYGTFVFCKGQRIRQAGYGECHMSILSVVDEDLCCNYFR